MSLFASLNLARLALGAQQAAIQTTGQNIANANTEGYARQRVEFTPTPANDLVFARVGTGVRIERIERIVDDHLEATLRESRTQLGQFGEQNRIIAMAESIFNDLEGGGLSFALGRFFDALQDLANQPQDPTTRSLVIEEARTLSQTFNFIDGGVRFMRRGIDEDIRGVVEEINVITAQVAELNRQIALAEDGGTQPDTANDFRTRRDALLGTLSELIDIRVIENDRGSVQVLSGNEALVFGNRFHTLELQSTSDGDITLTEVRVAETGQRFTPRSGRLAALFDGRDRLAPELRADLDTLAQGLLREFNAIHTTGEGLARLRSVRSTFQVADRNAPLSDAGFPFPIENGTFTIELFNEGDGTRESTIIPIDLDGAGSDTTLQEVVDRINTAVAVDHPEISAEITTDGYLEIRSSQASLTFTFRDDTAGFLGGVGIHTLFSGTNARNLAVAADLDPAFLSTGSGGGPGDNSAVLEMLALRDSGTLGTDGRTFEEYYNGVIGRIGIEGAEARERLTNQEAITGQLQNQRESLSGVSIDEEAIALVRYQRAYQGAARFLSVVDRLLETLINSV